MRRTDSPWHGDIGDNVTGGIDERFDVWPRDLVSVGAGVSAVERAIGRETFRRRVYATNDGSPVAVLSGRHRLSIGFGALLKPPPFEYHRVTSLDEALELLAEHGDEAKVLAGGQSLVPLLSMRLARPSVIVDLARVPGLDQISRTNGSVTIGAMVRERSAERSVVVLDDVPLLAQAMPLIGHLAIRNRGTIGGSVAHADPAAEIPAVALALDAEITVASAAGGERVIDAADFFQGFWTSGMTAEEVLTEVRFPVAAQGTGVAFEEAARRHGDFAMVGAAASLRLIDGTITDPRVVLIGVDNTPLRGTAGELILAGAVPGPDVYAEAVNVIVEDLTPPADLHGSAAFRKHLAGVLVRRAIEGAVKQAAGLS